MCEDHARRMTISNRSTRELILVADGSTRHRGVRVVQWYKVTDGMGSEILYRFGISCHHDHHRDRAGGEILLGSDRCDRMASRKRYCINSVPEGSGKRPYTVCGTLSEDEDVGLRLTLRDAGKG